VAEHDPGVGLGAEPKQQRPSSTRDRGERRRLLGSELDRIGQQVSGPAQRRRRVAVLRVRVKPDDRVEVDDATPLVLSDLLTW
jgi:hypothetical protein